MTLLIPLCLWFSLSVQAAEPTTDTPAVAVARAYFTAMDAKDLDTVGGLFAAESSIFETGGVEGTWAHYRDHHLGPEMGSIDSFKTELGDVTELSSKDNTQAVVTWPISYHVVLKDEQAFDSVGTVTFVMTGTPESYKIQHLHWSSRAKR